MYKLPENIEHLAEIPIERLSSAPQWYQAIVALAQRCEEYVREGWQSDGELARQIDQLHAEWIAHPKGEETRCR